MRKKDLRDGMKLVLRNGKVKIFKEEGTSPFSKHRANDLLNEDLTNNGGGGGDFDVMEVYVPMIYGGKDYTPIWKREEEVEIKYDCFVSEIGNTKVIHSKDEVVIKFDDKNISELELENEKLKEELENLREDVNLYNKESKIQDEVIDSLRKVLHEHQMLSKSLNNENNILYDRLSESKRNMEHITGKYLALQIYSNKTHSLERRVKQLEEINDELEKEKKKLSKQWYSLG